MAAKVLVVDDDENLMRLLVAALQSKGYEVHAIFNGKDALSYLSNEANVQSLSLFILDRMLPDMDGLEILQFFYGKYHDKVPILILSTLSAEKDVLEGLEKGAVDYIVKPFSVNVLLQKVGHLIK